MDPQVEEPHKKAESAEKAGGIESHEAEKKAIDKLVARAEKAIYELEDCMEIT